MLAERMSRLEPSGIRRIFELMATMEDPINLSIGQAQECPRRLSALETLRCARAELV